MSRRVRSLIERVVFLAVLVSLGVHAIVCHKENKPQIVITYIDDEGLLTEKTVAGFIADTKNGVLVTTDEHGKTGIMTLDESVFIELKENK